MSKKISGKNSITPVSKADANLLEQPASIRSIAVGHIYRGFDFLSNGRKPCVKSFPFGVSKYEWVLVTPCDA
jgi:hypothetical protein